MLRQGVLLALFLIPTLSFLTKCATTVPKTNRFASFALLSDNDMATNEDAPNVSFVLPIFPLRKTIKLPGESLTLNLYEERYLELARWVLENNRNATRRAFGALYASDKPQIVSQQGRGPIVPMIRPGDIGVIYPVERYEEAMIPTYGGMERRRRIRMVGTGVARFQIDSILHNGYGGGNAVVENDENGGYLPFVLAQVSLYHDAWTESNPDSTSEDDVLPLSTERIHWLASRAKLLGIPERIMHAEFESFLRVALNLREGVSEQRRALLKSRSVKDRLKK